MEINKNDGLPEVNYHCLIIIGEVKLFENRLTTEEFAEIQRNIRELDISSIANKLRLECDRLLFFGDGIMRGDFPLLPNMPLSKDVLGKNVKEKRSRTRSRQT